MSKYLTRGFVLSDIFLDNKFDQEEYHHLFLPVNLHVCVQGEHVLVVERSIRTFKEHVRSNLQGIPYPIVPKLMLRSLLERIECALNTFPVVSEFLSQPPIMTVEGRDLFHTKRPRLLFWTHVYIYTGRNNSMNARATLTICRTSGMVC